MTKQYDIKKINKNVMDMILPIVLEGILQMLAGLIIMGMIGRIDVITVSALGISQRITQMIWAFFKGVTTGAAVFVAHFYGAGEYEKMKQTIQQTIISSVVIVILVGMMIFKFSTPLLRIFDPSPELLCLANIYIKIVSFGLPFLAIMLVIGGVLQGMGNAKTPMFITMIMNMLNIVIGYILIFGKLGFQTMGIQGAALATVISQFTAAIIGLYIVLNKRGVLGYCLNKNFFHFNIRQICSIYKIGLPSSAESMFWQLAAIILTRSILTYGETAFAAHQLGLQAESISYMPATGFSIAATAFTGQALGANDKKLAKLYFRQIMKGSMLVTSLIVTILIGFPKSMMSLLTDNIEVINLGAIYLMFMGSVQFLQNASGVLMGVMRGAGYTNIPMIVAGAGLWGVRVPLTLAVVYVFKLPILFIWAAMSLDLIFRFLLDLIFYRKKDLYHKAGEKKLVSI